MHVPSWPQRRRRLETVSEWLLKPVVDFGARWCMILSALRGDLDRAHQARETSRRRPVHPVRQTVQHASAERIAAAGRIDDLVRLHAGNVDALTAAENFGALFAAGNDQRRYPLRD